MPYFSEASRQRLATCDKTLQDVFNAIIERVDCTIVCGHRSMAEQEEAFRTGKSKARFGQSPHNRHPALAVDAVPYPIDWTDRERMALFAGYVLATARDMGVELTWGGDWDGDFVTTDHGFSDMPHFEIKDWRARLAAQGED